MGTGQEILEQVISLKKTAVVLCVVAVITFKVLNRYRTWKILRRDPQLKSSLLKWSVYQPVAEKEWQKNCPGLGQPDKKSCHPSFWLRLQGKWHVGCRRRKDSVCSGQGRNSQQIINRLHWWKVVSDSSGNLYYVCIPPRKLLLQQAV